ncbi:MULTISPECIES: hypothetical protein, partial [unclassified Nocardiopsis]
MAVTTGAPDDEPEDKDPFSQWESLFECSQFKGKRKKVDPFKTWLLVHNTVQGDMFVSGTAKHDRRPAEDKGKADNTLAAQR